MTVPLRELYSAGLELFTAEALGSAEWLGLRSACSEWSNGDVIRHVISVQRHNVIPVLAGAEAVGPAVPLADVSTMEATAEWERTAIDAAAAVDGASDESIRGLYFPALDLAIHAWDIRAGLVHVGLAGPLDLPEPLLGFVEGYRQRSDERAIRKEGVFGPEQPAPDDATRTESFMAWAGRRVPRPRGVTGRQTGS